MQFDKNIFCESTNAIAVAAAAASRASQAFTTAMCIICTHFFPPFGCNDSHVLDGVRLGVCVCLCLHQIGCDANTSLVLVN